MAVILQERGRGKFKPAPDYKVDEVKELLNKKIEEERINFLGCSEEIIFEKLEYDEHKFNLLSLFSGCGGLDLGFELAGLKAVMGEAIMEEAIRDKAVFDANINNNVFNIIYVNDIFDEARETYEKNAGRYIYMDKSDIRKIKEFPKADIVLGGFPCPGFSEAGPRLVDDERNFLYLHFVRCLMQSQPKIFVAENVKGMMTLGKGEVFRQIIQDFAAAGYTIYHKLLNAAEYGVPQIRERVILVGVRNDIDFKYEYPKPTHGYDTDGLKEVVTLKDAIGDLEEDPGEYFTGSYSTIFMSRNRKKKWSDPSFTIQASGRQAPIHPAGEPMEHVGKDKYIFSDGEENNRRLSVKEIARIQTFPDWYEFSKGDKKKNENARLDLVYKQIGNAVPVRLAIAVAEPIAEWVKKEMKQYENYKKKNVADHFGDAERKILEFMKAGTRFQHNGKCYTVVLSGKPTCPKGEPKTDIYILAESGNEKIEIKISYKKSNADFLENKMSAERAEHLFGAGWERIIKNSIMAINNKFAERMLIYKNKYKRTQKGSITLGWKFELTNKINGELSGKMILTVGQVIDVYAGSNLSEDKKNASVCGKIITDSGVANYILIGEEICCAQDVIDKIIPIEKYVCMNPDIYFACKALNYRSFERKWDGNRPLSVQVEWDAVGGKLVPALVYERPLKVRGDEVARRLLKYMEKLNIKNTDDVNESNAGTDRIV